MMEKVMCELCGREEATYRHFGHMFCAECIDKFKDYVQTTVEVAEQERKAQNKISTNDVGEFALIKEGMKDIIRTFREFKAGEVLEISYEGCIYKDSVKCKVIGCHKSVSDGYIIELINL